MNKEVLKNQQFIYLLLGRLISVLGSTLLNFALALYVLNTTGSSAKFASVLALSAVVYLLITPISGVLADWWSRKNIMIVSDIVCGAAVAVLALVGLLTGDIHLFYIYLLVFVLSCCNAIDAPAVNTSVPLIVGEEHLVAANSANAVFQTIAQIIAPILGGILYSSISLEGILWLVFGLHMIAAFFEVLLKIPQVKKVFQKNWLSEFKEDFVQGFLFIKTSKVIVGTLVVCLLLNLILTPVITVGIPYLIKIDLGLSDIQFSVIEATQVVGMLIGSVIVAKFQAIPLKKLLRGMLLLMGLLTLMMGLSVVPLFMEMIQNTFMIFVWNVLLVLVLGSLVSITNIVAQTTLQKMTPQKLLGRVFGLVMTVSMALMPLGQMSYGLLFDGFSTGVVYIVSAILIIVIGWFSGMFFKTDEKVVALTE